MYIYIYRCACVCMYVCTYVCMYVLVYVCMYVCMCVCISGYTLCVRTPRWDSFAIASNEVYKVLNSKWLS